MSVKILVGDVRAMLAIIPDKSIHTCVTSPPYWGLRDYGTAKWEGGDPACKHQHICKSPDPKNPAKPCTNGRTKQGEELNRQICRCGALRIDSQIGLESSPAEYVAALVGVFREVRRVLRDDGTLWLNLGDSYSAHPGQRKETDEAGAKQQSLRGSTAAPSRTAVGLKPKDLVGIPWRVAFSLQADGWYLRQDIIWHKPNPMPESVRDRCTKAHEYIFLLSKSERYYYDSEAIMEPFATDPSENYPARATITGRGEQGAADARGNDRDKSGGFPPRSYKGSSFTKGKTGEVKPTVGQGERTEAMGRNKRSVWTVTTQPFKEAHFATFPPALIKPCILAGCHEGGTVLDPFFGAGTTGLVADRHGRNAIGIELNPAYAEMARKRIEGDSPLFAEVTT